MNRYYVVTTGNWYFTMSDLADFAFSRLLADAYFFVERDIAQYYADKWKCDIKLVTMSLSDAE